MGGIARLRQTITTYNLLFLDTMVFSYHLSDHPDYAPLSAIILQAIESGDVVGLTTTITLAELLTVPAKAQNHRAMQEYELYLTHFPNLRLIPLDEDLAREAALVRASTRLRMPDAIQIAAARLSRAAAIITNDRRWVGRVKWPDILLMDDYRSA